MGVPAMAQGVKNLTAVARVTAEVQVRSPAWCSGLNWCHHSCGLCSSYSLDSVPGLGTSICKRFSLKKKKQNPKPSRLPVSSLACKKLRGCHSVLTTRKKLNKLKSQQLFSDLSEK